MGLKDLYLRKKLIPPHPLTNFEIQAYYQNEPRFNGVYFRDNLPGKIKQTYVINLDEYFDIGIHWIDGFWVEHIPTEIKNVINNKNIIESIFRIQAYDSVMCGHFGIGFINFIFNGNNLTDFTNLFSPINFRKNDDIILIYF